MRLQSMALKILNTHSIDSVTGFPSNGYGYAGSWEPEATHIVRYAYALLTQAMWEE